eukprot:scaffold43116_cov41-Cyclotella_meneghiniana.AAC.4
MWFSAVITGYQTLKSTGKYGLIRFYNVCYDDDNTETLGIIDACIFSEEDYLLSMSGQKTSENDREWIGVKNIVDKKSNDTWAKNVGWYEVSIDGKKYSFSRLVQALRAHDADAIAKHGDGTLSPKLNLSYDMIFM